MNSLREQAEQAQLVLHDAPVEEHAALWNEAYDTLEVYGKESFPRSDRIHGLYHDTLHNLGETAVRLTDVLEDVHNRVHVFLAGSQSDTGLQLLEQVALVYRGSKDLCTVQVDVGKVVRRAIDSGNFSVVQTPGIRQIAHSTAGASERLKTEVQSADNLFTTYLKTL